MTNNLKRKTTRAGGYTFRVQARNIHQRDKSGHPIGNPNEVDFNGEPHTMASVSVCACGRDVAWIVNGTKPDGSGRWTLVDVTCDRPLGGGRLYYWYHVARPHWKSCSLK